MDSFKPLSASLPPLRPLPQPGAPAVLPVNPANFNRISSLLGRNDQFKPSSPPISTGGLQNPLALFAKRTPTPPATPVKTTPTAAPPALGVTDMRHQISITRLKSMPPQELKRLGENDKKAFFEALLPAAIESEKTFGVPAEVTLAQAALESGWAESPIGGYNIFGIKGSGPAGTVSVRTHEFYNGKRVNISDNFAKYNNFYEAIQRHGKLFHNGYYDKAVTQYAKDSNATRFIDNIHGIYATDPKYSQKLKTIINDFGLDDMVNRTAMV